MVHHVLFGTGLGQVAAPFARRHLTGMGIYASHFTTHCMPLLQREGSHAAPQPFGGHGAAPPITTPGGRNAADHPGPAGLPAAGSVLPIFRPIAMPSVHMFCDEAVTLGIADHVSIYVNRVIARRRCRPQQTAWLLPGLVPSLAPIPSLRCCSLFYPAMQHASVIMEVHATRGRLSCSLARGYRRVTMLCCMH
jgi:hypothetical protein